MTWQPIATAPKGGIPIRLKCGSGYETEGFWTESSSWDGCGQSTWTEGDEYSEDDFQNGYTDGQGYIPLEGVTHWMPLPAPPADAIERGEV